MLSVCLNTQQRKANILNLNLLFYILCINNAVSEIWPFQCYTLKVIIAGLDWCCFFPLQRIWFVLECCLFLQPDEYWWTVFLNLFFGTVQRNLWKNWSLRKELFSVQFACFIENEKNKYEKNFMYGSKNFWINCGFFKGVFLLVSNFLDKGVSLDVNCW